MGLSLSRTSNQIHVSGDGNHLNTKTSSKSHSSGTITALGELGSGLNPTELFIEAEDLAALLIDNDDFDELGHDGILDIIGKMTSNNSRLRGVIKASGRFMDFITKTAQFIQGVTGKGCVFLGQDYDHLVSSVETFNTDFHGFMDKYSSRTPTEAKYHEDLHDAGDILVALNDSIGRAIQRTRDDRTFDKINHHQETFDAGAALKLLESAVGALLVASSHSLKQQSDVMGSVLGFSNYHMIPTHSYVEKVAKATPPALADQSYDSISNYGHNIGVWARRHGELGAGKMVTSPTFLNDTVAAVTFKSVPFVRIKENAARVKENQQVFPLDVLRQPFDKWSSILYPWAPSYDTDRGGTSVARPTLSGTIYTTGVKYGPLSTEGTLTTELQVPTSSGGLVVQMASHITGALGDVHQVAVDGMSAWFTTTFSVTVEASADNLSMADWKVGFLYRSAGSATKFRECVDVVKVRSTTKVFYITGKVDIDLTNVKKGGLNEIWAGSAGDCTLCAVHPNRTTITSVKIHLNGMDVVYQTYGAYIPILVPDSSLTCLYDAIGSLSDGQKLSGTKFSVNGIWSVYIAGLLRYFDRRLLLEEYFHERHPIMATTITTLCNDHDILFYGGAAGSTPVKMTPELVGKQLYYLIGGADKWLLSSGFNPLYKCAKDGTNWRLGRYVAAYTLSVCAKLSHESVFTTKHENPREFWRREMDKYQRA